MQIIVEDLHRNMEQRKMAKKLDRILNYYNTKKGKPENMQQLPHNIFNKSSKQSTTTNRTIKTEGTSGKHNGRRTSWFQGREKHY